MTVTMTITTIIVVENRKVRHALVEESSCPMRRHDKRAETIFRTAETDMGSTRQMIVSRCAEET
jgi:hypothetical protein